MSNRWDERYQRGDMTDKPPEPLLVEAASAAPAGEVLDLACGAGRHALWLARQGWRVTAVDYSKIALTLLQEQAEDLPIRIVRADIEEGEFTIERERFSLIVDTFFLYRPLFPAIRDGLQLGGVFLGVFPMEGDSRNDRCMNPAYLMAPGELPTYFKHWEILRYNEGHSAQGNRLLAEIIARRPASSE